MYITKIQACEHTLFLKSQLCPQYLTFSNKFIFIKGSLKIFFQARHPNHHKVYISTNLSQNKRYKTSTQNNNDIRRNKYTLGNLNEYEVEVDSNNKSYGTGTLIKIKKNDRYFYFLISNEHVIQDCKINSNYILIITYYSAKNSRKKAKITLNKEERIIKSYKNNLDIDATIVQIIPEDNINDEYFYHFNTTFNNFLELENKFIYIFQYPGYQKKLKYSED